MNVMGSLAFCIRASLQAHISQCLAARDLRYSSGTEHLSWLEGPQRQAWNLELSGWTELTSRCWGPWVLKYQIKEVKKDALVALCMSFFKLLFLASFTRRCTSSPGFSVSDYPTSFLQSRVRDTDEYETWTQICTGNRFIASHWSWGTQNTGKGHPVARILWLPLPVGTSKHWKKRFETDARADIARWSGGRFLPWVPKVFGSRCLNREGNVDSSCDSQQKQLLEQSRRYFWNILEKVSVISGRHF